MSPPTRESDQKTKPTFKASLTIQKLQSPTKHKQQQQQTKVFSSADNDVLNEALLALDGVNNNNGGDNNNINIVKQKYFESLPPGYKFDPTDEELIVHYLMKKVANEELPISKIRDVNLYKHNPNQLAGNFQTLADKEWYFFTPRDRKYRNGNRPNRAAGDGYWKATGADKIVEHQGKIVGYRKALVFYLGRPPKGDKTKWIMHEFRVKEDASRSKKGTDDMRLDNWVLCRIYQKANQGRGRGSYGSRGEPEEIEDPKPSTPTPSSVRSSVFDDNVTSANAVVETNYNYNPVGGSNDNVTSANAVVETNYNYNPVGGSNRFMANPLINNNYPQMPYQNGGLVPSEMPHYPDGSILVPNYAAMFNSHNLQRPMNFNYGPRPPPPPPAHPIDNIAMPMPMPMPGQYTRGDMALDLKPRPVEEDGLYWSFDDFDFSGNYMQAFDQQEFDNNKLPDDGSYNPPTGPNLPEDGSY